MQNEIDKILSGLRAELHRETFNHRGEGAGRVRGFVADCRSHRERYAGKLRNIRASAEASHFSAIDAGVTKVANMVNEAIDAAEKAGRVDFA